MSIIYFNKINEILSFYPISVLSNFEEFLKELQQYFLSKFQRRNKILVTSIELAAWKKIPINYHNSIKHQKQFPSINLGISKKIR